MRGWFGPVGKCGCCGGDDPPFPCECPGGGNSRKFVGTPTVVIEIDGLPSTIAWDCLFRAQSPIGGSQNDRWSWESIEINGLDAINGTYAYPMSKMGDGCIDFDNTPGVSFSIDPVNTDITVRDLGSTAFFSCTPTSIFPGPVTLQPVVGVARNPFPYTGAYSAYFSLDYRRSTAQQDWNIFSMLGRNLMRCVDDYDPALAPGSSEVGSSPGITSYPSYRPNTSEEIWLARYYNSSGNCYPFEAQVPYTVVGSFRAEIIDDVP